MIAGAPHEARWVRAEPRRSVSPSDLDRIVRRACGAGRALEVQPLTEGLRNANFKVHLNVEPEWIVVRIYEHDPSLCQKEIDLFGLIGSSLPVPRVIHAEPEDLDGLPPFLVMEYVDAVSFHDLKRSGDRDAIGKAAFSIGETLAQIGRFTFPESGWLAPGPTVSKPIMEGVDPMPRFVDQCLESDNLQGRMPSELREHISAFAWANAADFAEMESQRCLVHGDFGKRNVLVRGGHHGWSVAAVIDWEFAISGSPLADLGHFLRYERASRPVAEPQFSQGYVHGGGILPPRWRQRARALDADRPLRKPDPRRSSQCDCGRTARTDSRDC